MTHLAAAFAIGLALAFEAWALAGGARGLLITVTALLVVAYYFFGMLEVEENYYWSFRVLKKGVRRTEIVLRVAMLVWMPLGLQLAASRAGRVLLEPGQTALLALLTFYVLVIAWDTVVIRGLQTNAESDGAVVRRVRVAIVQVMKYDLSQADFLLLAFVALLADFPVVASVCVMCSLVSMVWYMAIKQHEQLQGYWKRMKENEVR